MKDFEVLIASVPDREKTVAEIWFANTLIAEVSQERDSLEIDIYRGQRLTFKFDDVLGILEIAKNKLVGSDKPN